MIKLVDDREKDFSLIGDVSRISDYLGIEKCKDIHDIEDFLKENEETFFHLIPLKYEIVEGSDPDDWVHDYCTDIEEAKKTASYWFFRGCQGPENCIKTGRRIELREIEAPSDDNNYNYNLVEYYKGYKIIDELDNIIAVLDYTYSRDLEDIKEHAAESLTNELLDSYCKYCKEDKSIYLYNGDPEDFEGFSKTPIESELFIEELTYQDIENITKIYDGYSSSLPYFII